MYESMCDLTVSSFVCVYLSGFESLYVFFRGVINVGL